MFRRSWGFKTRPIKLPLSSSPDGVWLTIHISSSVLSRQFCLLVCKCSGTSLNVNCTAKFYMPKVPKSVSCGNVIDILLSTQRKETQGNMLRKIDLAYLWASPRSPRKYKHALCCPENLAWWSKTKSCHSLLRQPGRDRNHSDSGCDTARSTYCQKNITLTRTNMPNSNDLAYIRCWF